MYSLPWKLIFTGFFLITTLRANSRLGNLRSLRQRLPSQIEFNYGKPSDLHYETRRYVQEILPSHPEAPVSDAEFEFMPDSRVQQYYGNRKYFGLPVLLKRSPFKNASKEQKIYTSGTGRIEELPSNDADRQERSSKQKNSQASNGHRNEMKKKRGIIPMNLKRSVQTNEKGIADLTDVTANHTIGEQISVRSTVPSTTNTDVGKDLQRFFAQENTINSIEHSTNLIDQSTAYTGLFDSIVREKKDETGTFYSVWPPSSEAYSSPAQHDPVMILRDVGDMIQALVQPTADDAAGFLPYQMLDQSQMQEYIPMINATAAIPSQNGAPPGYYMPGVFSPPIAFRLPPGPMAFIPGQQQVSQSVNPGLIPSQAVQLIMPGQSQLSQTSYSNSMENSVPAQVPNPAMPAQFVYSGQQNFYQEQSPDLDSELASDLSRIPSFENPLLPKKFRDEAMLLSIAKAHKERLNMTQITQMTPISTTEQHLMSLHDYSYNGEDYNEAEKTLEALEKLPPVHMPVREIRVPLESFGMAPVTIADVDITNFISNISTDISTKNKNPLHDQTSLSGTEMTSTTNKLKSSDMVANSSKVLLKIMNELEEIKLDRSATGGKEGLPCQVGGSWVSDIAGIRLDMDVMANGTMLVHVANRVPPKDSGLLTCSWIFEGEAPFQRSGLFSIFAKNPVTKRLASFLGQCRVCGGSEMVTGMWLIAREPRDCRDTHLSVTQHPDVFRREVLHLLKSKQLRDVGTSIPTEDITLSTIFTSDKTSTELNTTLSSTLMTSTLSSSSTTR